MKSDTSSDTILCDDHIVDQEQTINSNKIEEKNLDDIVVKNPKHVIEKRERENKRRNYAQYKRMSGEAYEGLKKNRDSKKWEYAIKVPRTIIESDGLCGKRCNKDGDKFVCPKITSDHGMNYLLLIGG